MPGSVTLEEATGISPIPSPELDQTLAIIAPASAGSFLPLKFGDPDAVSDEYTSGPLVRDGQHLVAKTRTPFYGVRVAATGAAGAYGSIDITQVAGTCEPAARASSVPVDEYAAYWRIVDGGTVLTDGITYYESDDEGRTLSGLKRLGTADYLSIAGTGITVDLNPPEAELAAFVDDLRLQTIAHLAETSSSIHGIADATSGAGIPGSTVNTLALARTCMIALKAAGLLHVVLTSGGVHGAADSTAETALNAISISASSTGQQVLTAALAYADAFFGDGATTDDAHTLRTAGTVHGAEDTVNVITAATPSRGTLLADDVIELPTTAPKWSEAELAAGFTALASSSVDCTMILISGRVLPSEADTISTGLDALDNAGKPCMCIVQARKRTDLETEAQWVAALVSEWEQITDSRIVVCAGDYWITYTNGSRTRVYAQGFSAAFARRLVDNPRWVSPTRVADGPLEEVALVDELNQLVGHDEQEVPGLEDGRFITLFRVPNVNLRRGGYVAGDYVMRGDQERIYSSRVRRLVNAMKRVAAGVAWSLVGETFDVEVTAPGVGLLSGPDADSIAAKIAAPIRAGFTEDISDAEASDLITIDRTVAIDGDTFSANVTANFTPKKELRRITIKFAIRVGG